jgi:putative phosphoribosyl transferase
MITQHEEKLAGCRRETVRIPCGNGVVDGDLEIPSKARAIVLFVHGRGSNRFSHCNQLVARILRESGIGTLFFDSLTPFEQTEDEVTSRLRFDIEPLTHRLVDVTHWLMRHVPQYSIGYFCSSTGLAAALLAAAELGKSVNAIVSRRGRPDLAADALPHVLAPTLLIIG